MRKHFEVEHLKYSTLLKEVRTMKEKLSIIEKDIKLHSDVHPTKREFASMKQFMKDLKTEKREAFTPLEELRKR